jgi:hypothetical protein
MGAQSCQLSAFSRQQEGKWPPDLRRALAGNNWRV